MSIDGILSENETAVLESFNFALRVKINRGSTFFDYFQDKLIQPYNSKIPGESLPLM